MKNNIRINTSADLDINQQNDMIICNVQPGNNRTRVLKFNITDFGMDLAFPTGTFAQMTWVKPDNTVIIEDSKTKNSNISMEKITSTDIISSDTTSSTIVTYILSANAIAVSGICKFKIDFLLNADDGKGGSTLESLSTVSGKVRVAKEIVNNKTIISSNEYKAAEEIIEEGRKVIDEANESIDDCNTATENCNKATNDCNKAIDNCNKATNDCKTATNNCNAAIQILQGSDVAKKRTKYCNIEPLDREHSKEEIGSGGFMDNHGNVDFDLGENHIKLHVGTYGDYLAYPQLDDDNYIKIDDSNLSAEEDIGIDFNITDTNKLKISLAFFHDGEIKETIVCSLVGFDDYGDILHPLDFRNAKLYKHLGNYYLAEENYNIPNNNEFCTEQNTFNFKFTDSRITSFNMHEKKEYMPVSIYRLNMPPVYFNTSEKATINIYNMRETKLLTTITATPQSFNQSVITNARYLDSATIYKINGNYVIDGSKKIPVYLEANYAEEIENVTFKFPMGEVNQNIKKDGTIDFTGVIPEILKKKTKYCNAITPLYGNYDRKEMWVYTPSEYEGILKCYISSLDNESYPFIRIDNYFIIRVYTDPPKPLNILNNNKVTLSLLLSHEDDISQQTVTCSLLGFDQILKDFGQITTSDINDGKIYMYQGNYYLAEKNYNIPNHTKFYTDKNTFNFVLPDSNITSFEMSPKEYLFADFIGDVDINFDTSKNAVINIYHTYGKKILKTITATPQSFNQSIITNAEDLEGAKIYEINDNYVIDGSKKVPIYLEANYAEEIENVTFKSGDKTVVSNIKQNGIIDISDLNVDTVKTVNGISPNEDGNVTIEASFSDNAVTHTASTAVGSETKGVYVNADGAAMPMKYSVNKDVPSNAVFTDTTYDIATTTTAGLMSADDKKNLNEITSGAKTTEASSYAMQSKSWAVGGTGVRPDENVNNSKYFAEETKKLLDEASNNVNPTKYSAMQKKQVTLSTLQRVTINDEYINSEIAGVYFYLDLDSFSFQKDYLYTEPDSGQPLEDFYDENDSNYSFSMNVAKYYIYVCNKDTGNVLDSMSVDIDPYYYSGGAEEFLSDISYNYYFYDKTKQDYVESSVAPSGVNAYYETSGYVYAYANSLSLLNNILIHDTAADIIFSGSENVSITSSNAESTSSYSSLSSLTNYMTKPYGKKGIVFIAGTYVFPFVLFGYYDGIKTTNTSNTITFGGAITSPTGTAYAYMLIRGSGQYLHKDIPKAAGNSITVKAIGVIRLQ